MESRWQKSITILKCGKAAGIDGISLEILKYSEDAVTELMFFICDSAWRQGVSDK